MKFTIEGTEHTSRELRKVHRRLSGPQQRWIFAQLLDDMYAIQRMSWTRRYAGRSDKERRADNPARYMHQTGALERSATGPRGRYSYSQVTEKFALLSLVGSAVGLAKMHHLRGREVIAAPSRRESRQMVETMGRYIFAGQGPRS